MKNFKITSTILILIFINIPNSFCQIVNQKAEVTFYRKPLQFLQGRLYKMKIFLDNKKVVEIYDFQTVTLIVNAGNLEFKSRILRKSTFVLNAKPNYQYYIEVKVGGIFHDKVIFKLIDSKPKNNEL